MRIFIALLFVAVCAAAISAPLVEDDIVPGVVVFKLSSNCKASLHCAGASCGVPAVDRQLAGMGAIAVQPRFRTNPKAPVEAPDLSLILVAHIPERLSPAGAASVLARLPEVTWAEPQYVHHILESPDDPLYSTAPYLAAMHAEQAWDIHKGEEGAQQVIVADVDTGCRWRHEDLVANVWNNPGEDADNDGVTVVYDNGWRFDPDDENGVDDDGNGYVDDFIGWDFMADITGAQDNDPDDPGVHGTRTSGIAAMVTDNATGCASISWNVSLMPLSCTPPESPSSIFNAFDAIVYAAENGADVINCSWGGVTFSHAGREVVDYAWSLGAVLVGAAGNSNNPTPMYPGAYPHAVCVASATNSGVKYGSTTYGPQIDVCAPTDSVVTTHSDGYATISGYTSYSAPVASGLCALIRSQHPEWNAATVVNQLVASCSDIDALNPGRENQLGEGLLNAQEALGATNPQPDQELRLALFSYRPTGDTDDDGAVEPGETFSLDVSVRNWGLPVDDVTCTLVSHSADATVLDATETLSLVSDDFASLDDAFLVQVSPNAGSQYLLFSLQISSALPIVSGDLFYLRTLVNAGGHLVWENVQGSQCSSGLFLRDELQSLGLPVTYGITFPPSLQSFETVWLCFNTAGWNIHRLDKIDDYVTLRDYLLDGGRLFIEGGDVVGWDMPVLPVGGDTLSSDVLWPLLGLAEASDGADHAVSRLSGEHGWLGNGMLFSSSEQSVSFSIDTFTPGEDGVESLREEGLGVTMHQSIGAHGQRCVLSSYAIGRLTDGEPPSTRSELVARIYDFLVSDSLSLPAVDSLTVAASGDSLRLAWSYPFPVDGFDVYSDDAPDGGFSTLEQQTTATQLLLDASPHARRYYRVIARRLFGR